MREVGFTQIALIYAKPGTFMIRFVKHRNKEKHGNASFSTISAGLAMEWG